MAGEFSDEAGVLLRIQWPVVVEEPRQYVLYECLDRLRLYAKLARNELSGGIGQDGRLRRSACPVGSVKLPGSSAWVALIRPRLDSQIGRFRSA